MKKTASKWYDISCKADGDTTTINIFDQKLHHNYQVSVYARSVPLIMK